MLCKFNLSGIIEAIMDTFNPTQGNKETFKRWQEAGIFKASEEGDKKNNRYVLDMFPYPSGEGLHVGHVESYTGSDIIARYFRMKGHNVLHPIGWDAFGLPAENYAIKKGIHPQETTKENIARFTAQLQSLGFSYDWSREVNTSDPSYYKWTQWLFLKLYEKGLAYRKKARVNWCNSCQTVLANEQVIDGRCERCDNEVVQKNLEQWFFKITDYAQRLLDDLEGLDWPESIKQMQRNWIGRSEGAELEFAIEGADEKIKVFTTRPDTLYGATYMVLAPEHQLVKEITSDQQEDDVDEYVKKTSAKSVLQRTELDKEKTGVFTGAYALHPITGARLPIWVADYVIMEYGGGAVMAVPAHDERDFEFAKKYRLPVVEVVSGGDIKTGAYTGTGRLINSGDQTGMDSQKAKKVITEKVSGQWKVTYKLRDWLVSRQRYWGAPIPIIYCGKCGAAPVPEKDLPVKLPRDVDFQPTGESPLAQSKSFHDVKCPKCGGKAKRESDTMDTFVCSSWYYLRYLDPRNSNEPFSRDEASKWMPVDIYIGGAEHAVLHLLYSRFITKFLYDQKAIEATEPFAKLRNQGVVLGPDNQKMSKSRGNVINPDEIVESYGPDVLRLYEMFMGPFDQMKAWNSGGVEGVFRFIKKVTKLYEAKKYVESNEYLNETKHLVKSTAEKIEQMAFNTVVSDFMTYINSIADRKYSRADLEVFATIFAVFAPFTAETLWSILGKEGLASAQKWPDIGAPADESNCTVVLQVNGKVRDNIEINADLSEKETVERAKQSIAVQKHLDGQEVVKTIVVAKRLVNFVTKPK